MLTDDSSSDDGGGSADGASPDATSSSGSESGSDAGKTRTRDGGATHDAGKDGASATCVLERIDSGIPYDDAGTPVINGKPCDLHDNIGCVSLQGSGRCVPRSTSCASNEVVFKCLARTDCASGQLCCGVDNSTQIGSECVTPGSDGQCPATPQGAAQFCQTTCDCPSGVDCIPQQCELSGFVPANITLCGLQNSMNYSCKPR